ncbi:FAD-dependent oxidoreductase [bacterium]|nr:FAD-dependent oxidoreductase [bacterium]
MDTHYDLGIIGGGPAGYTSALHASLKGKKVVLFEKDEIGGVCLNRGCIPTKSILYVSEIYKKVKEAEKYGIKTSSPEYDYHKVLERKNGIVERLRKGIELALKNAKVDVVKSSATAISQTEIESDGILYNCDEIICAVGSSPKIIKGLEFDGEFLLSSDDVLNLTKLPKSIVIIGSGAIGIEWARIFSNFGVETIIVELAEHLLPIADIEVSKRIERIFKSQGIKYYTNTTASVKDKMILLSNGEVINPEKVLVAVGRTPNLIKKIKGINYIGDVKGEIQLAHYAIKQAIENIDGIKFDTDLTPSVVYGTPEIAWIGKREQDGEFKKSLILLSALGKAQCDGETDGFIKILSKEGKILGAHIVSPEASALIQQIAIAMNNNISVKNLKEICFAHPTYSEGIFDCVQKL